MLRWIFLAITHLGALAVGFALGIYLLPILTAPDSPDQEMLTEQSQNAVFTAELTPTCWAHALGRTSNALWMHVECTLNAPECLCRFDLPR